MADQIDLVAEPRLDVGRGASRRLRRIEELVPAIIYGAGKDPVPVSIPHKDLHRMLEDEGFYSRILTINVGPQADQVILKALQRHPARDRVMHADFLRVRMDEEITLRVPLHFINEDTSPGVKNEGGVVSHIETDIEITCLPGNLPEFIDVDMAEVHLGDSVLQSDLVLPEGVAIAGVQDEDNDPMIASVHAPRAIEIETEEELEAAAAAAASEDEEEAAGDEADGESDGSDDDASSDDD